MTTFPRSKKEEADALLDQLYDSLDGDTERLAVTGGPARDSSGAVTPQMREIRDLLLADGLIWESRRMSLGITEKGVAKVASARGSQVLKMDLDAPYPTRPEEIEQELEYWVRRQHDGEPGSNHWIQAQARIDHLRYLNQRRVEAREMAKRSKTHQSTTNNEASRLVLAQLLSEFRQRKFTTADLRDTYKGLPPKDLKDRCVAEGISEVDFDLAIGDLTASGLIDTGPKEHIRNDPYSSVVMIGFFTSKNEYSYLTENGYREAVRLESNEPQNQRSSQEGHATIIHGDQFNNFGQVAALGTHSVGTMDLRNQWTAIQNEVDLKALTRELEQLRGRLQQTASSSSDYQRLVLLSEAEEHAERHDGSKVLEALSKVGKGVLDVAKDIGTEIAAKVIARSMGLEL